MDTKAPEIKAALKELSSQLDIIINGAIKEYSAETGAEVDMSAIPSYKAMNKIITGSAGGIAEELGKPLGKTLFPKQKHLFYDIINIYKASISRYANESELS